MKKRLALSALFVALVAVAPVKVQSTPDPTGVYRCDGTSPDGQSYRAAVQIVRNGDTFLVRWLTPEGVANIGVGVVSGSTLSVGYIGTTAGVVVYKMDDAKRLIGEWTDLEAIGKVHKETLTRLADGEKIFLPKNGPLF
jgi:hypothetical protein